MKKNRIQFLYALLAFLAAEAIQLVIVLTFQLMYGFLLGLRLGIERASKGVVDPESIRDKLESSMSQNIIYLISVVAVFVCGIVFFFWYRYEIKGERRGDFRKIFSVRRISLFILLGVGCQFFVSGIMSLTKQYFTELFNEYANQIDNLTGGNAAVVLLLVVLIAPIAEELIFRGIILHKASRAIPFLGANLLQAMLFGIYHLNIIQGIYAAFIGFILGLVYHKFKTIFASMFLHMVINSSSFLLYLFPENKFIYFVLMIVGGVFTFGSLILILRPSRSFQEQS